MSLIAVAQGGFYRLDLMETNSVDITARRFALQDKAYADFQSKLLPNIPREAIIGVRTPEFKKYVAEIEACGQMKLERFEF